MRRHHVAGRNGTPPIDLERDSFEPPGEQQVPWPDDSAVLYWWRPAFWRRDRGR